MHQTEGREDSAKLQMTHAERHKARKRKSRRQIPSVTIDSCVQTDVSDLQESRSDGSDLHADSKLTELVEEEPLSAEALEKRVCTEKVVPNMTTSD